MKKKLTLLIVLALALSLVFALSSCGGSNTDTDTSTETETEQATDTETESATDTESGTETEVESDTDVESDTETDAESDTSADTESDTEVESNSDTETETESDEAIDSSSDTESSEPECNHVIETIPGVEPTCTKAGLTEGKKCSVCDEVLVAQGTVSALGHVYEGNYTCKTCEETLVTSEGLKYSLSEDGTYYMVKGEGTCTDKDIVIPYTYNDLPVKSIGERAFEDCDSLTSVTIPDSIASIESYAFYACISLTSVTIPDSVTSIGEYAFNCCYTLTNVTIGNSVTSIGNEAFQYCYKLVEVYNLSSLDITVGSEDNGYVGYYPKVIHTSLNEESILKTTDDGYVFAVVNDSEIYLVDYIGNETELTLPESYKGKNYEIYLYAFYYREDLTKVTIPDSVTSIGRYAFCRCSSLTSITIGNSVSSIGEYAFRYCSNLTSIVIPDSVTSIGGFAFHGCDSLTIYCEATSEPSGWDSNWNYSNRPVYWNS